MMCICGHPTNDHHWSHYSRPYCEDCTVCGERESIHTAGHVFHRCCCNDHHTAVTA